jgi:hypothetical protein
LLYIDDDFVKENILVGLNVLVIGRGNKSRAQQVENDHSLSFKRFATEVRDDGTSLVISSCNYDFIFQHLSPRNAEWSESLEFWRNEGKGNKIIGFSGGLPQEEYLSADVPCLWGCSDQSEAISGLTWNLVPQDFRGNAEDLLKLLIRRSTGVPNSMALSILCQGYLIAWACSQGHIKKGMDGISDPIKDALENMGFKEICGHKDDLAVVFENAKEKFTDEDGGVKQAKWWQVFEPKALKVIDDEREACGIQKDNFKEVLNLATSIDSGNVDGASPELVAEAYLQIKAQEKKLAS